MGDRLLGTVNAHPDTGVGNDVERKKQFYKTYVSTTFTS